MVLNHIQVLDGIHIVQLVVLGTGRLNMVKRIDGRYIPAHFTVPS